MPQLVKLVIGSTPQELEDNVNHFLDQCTSNSTVSRASYDNNTWHQTVTYFHPEGNGQCKITREEQNHYEKVCVFELNDQNTPPEDIAKHLGLKINQVKDYLNPAKSKKK